MHRLNEKSHFPPPTPFSIFTAFLSHTQAEAAALPNSDLLEVVLLGMALFANTTMTSLSERLLTRTVWWSILLISNRRSGVLKPLCCPPI